MYFVHKNFKNYFFSSTEEIFLFLLKWQMIEVDSIYHGGISENLILCNNWKLNSQFSLEGFLLSIRKCWVFLCGLLWQRLGSKMEMIRYWGGEHGSRARNRTLIVLFPGDLFWELKASSLQNENGQKRVHIVFCFTQQLLVEVVPYKPGVTSLSCRFESSWNWDKWGLRLHLTPCGQ